MSLLVESFAFIPAEEQPPSPENLKQGRLTEVSVFTRVDVNELPEIAFPITFKIIFKEQQQDQTLQKKPMIK